MGGENVEQFAHFVGSVAVECLHTVASAEDGTGGIQGTDLANNVMGPAPELAAVAADNRGFVAGFPSKYIFVMAETLNHYADKTDGPLGEFRVGKIAAIFECVGDKATAAHPAVAKTYHNL